MRMAKRLLFFLLLLIVAAAPWTGSVWLDQRAALEAWQAHDYPECAARAAAAAARCPFCGDMWTLAGQAYALSGDWTAASHAFQKAARQNALSAAGWLNWGKVEWQRGASDSAVQIWKQGAALYPDAADLWASLAYAYASRQDETNERAALNHLLALDETRGWAHYRLALWLMADGSAEALSHLRRAADLDETLTEPADALRLAFNQAMTLPPDEGARLIGQALGGVEAWPQAESAFRRALQQNPNNGEFWAWLAEAQQHTGQDPAAAFDRALQLAPDSPLVLGLYGLYASRQGHWAQALDALEQAVASAPDDVYWWLLLGEARARNGDVQSAQEAYRRAAALTPSQPQNWYALAQFCFEYNIALDGEGLDAALRAYLLDQTQPSYAVLVGRYYMALNRPDDALKYLTQARDLAPHDPRTQLFWGIWQAQYGNPAAARAALQQALSQGDDNIRAQARYWLETLP